MRAYTMAGIADRITCPTLVLDPENDQFFRGEPRQIFDALRCPKELITSSAAEGAGEHCQEGAGLLTEQRVFDRLDALLRSPAPEPRADAARLTAQVLAVNHDRARADCP